MKISSRRSVTPTTVHETVRVYQLLQRWSLAEQTKGTYLEFIDDFEIDPGAKAEPHFHNTHEWYFILEGNGVVQIEKEARREISFTYRRISVTPYIRRVRERSGHYVSRRVINPSAVSFILP
jgi:oxalate decarboxylase/phosphoglucose isomerase-like protein (cupin superfamily)